MSKANMQSQDKELPIRIQIVCSILQEYGNKYEKGQKPGEATRVENSGELDSLEPGMPIIETNVGVHEATIDEDKKQAFRVRKDAKGNTIKEDMVKVEISREDFDSEEEYKRAYVDAYNKAFRELVNTLNTWKENEGIKTKTTRKYKDEEKGIGD